MRRVFVDSGGWLSVVIRSDRYHPEGSAYYKRLLDERARLVTSDYVLDEVITRLRYDVGHDAAKRFIELVENAIAGGVLEVVYVDEGLWREAVQLFLQYADVRLSFTDCTSFAILTMRTLGLWARCCCQLLDDTPHETHSCRAP